MMVTNALSPMRVVETFKADHQVTPDPPLFARSERADDKASSTQSGADVNDALEKPAAQKLW